jgi:adenosylhomocysteinase
MVRTPPDVAAWASSAVRTFAAATNLLVAGRRFRIVGDGPDAGALRQLLVELGAREAEELEPTDQLWCVGDADASTAAIERAADRPRGSSLVVVDAGRHAPAVDEDAFGPTRLVRPGVLGAPGLSDDVFFVSTGRELEHDAAAQSRIRWAGRFMPVSRQIARTLAQDGLLRGTRVGVSMVLEPKTAMLSLLLQDAGADVVVYAHADETDDAVADALRDAGLAVFASSRATVAEQRGLALEMLDREPHILLDDGAHVIRLAHEARPELLPAMIGAAEETTSGLRPLRVMASRDELHLPVIAVNDARSKTFFDNRYGTGQSCVFAVLDIVDRLASATHRVRSGGSACVIGFGPVGEGVAQVLRALGLRVVVVERDAVRALQAVTAGYRVAPLADAVGDADLVISATGVRDTIPLDVMRRTAPGAVLAVAGGVEQEIALDDALAAGAVRTEIAADVARWGLPDGPDLLVLADGGCINVVAAEGNPVEIMDLSFAVQLQAVRTLLVHGDELDRTVHAIDPTADQAVASAALAAFGAGTEPPVRTGATTSPTGPDPDPDLDVRTTRFGAP